MPDLREELQQRLPLNQAPEDPLRKDLLAWSPRADTCLRLFPRGGLGEAILSAWEDLF